MKGLREHSFRKWNHMGYLKGIYRTNQLVTEMEDVLEEDGRIT